MELPQQKLKTLKELEREHMITALKRFNGSISKSHKAIGMARTTFYKKMHEYKIPFNPAQRAVSFLNLPNFKNDPKTKAYIESLNSNNVDYLDVGP